MKSISKIEKKILTLCIIHEDERVLLGMKKRGFGEGRWNGFGGKIEEGESIEDAAIREVREEVGIEVRNIEHRGVMEFQWKDTPDILEVHIFSVTHFSGEPRESDEMKPQWFHKNDIPFDAMWPDDKHWFPLFFDEKKFRGKILFDDKDKILDIELKGSMKVFA